MSQIHHNLICDFSDPKAVPSSGKPELPSFVSFVELLNVSSTSILGNTLKLNFVNRQKRERDKRNLHLLLFLSARNENVFFLSSKENLLRFILIMLVLYYLLFVYFSAGIE